MKKQLLAILLILTFFTLNAQKYTIEIHTDNRAASLLMPSTEYNSWKANDEFKNKAIREALFKEIYKKFDDEFDFIFLILNEDDKPSKLPDGELIQVANNVSGIGLNIFDDSSNYGSSGKLKAVIHLTKRIYLLGGPTLHELLHNWANFGIPTEGTDDGTNFVNNYQPHWGFTGGNIKGQLGGFKQSTLIDKGAGSYSVEPFGNNENEGHVRPYSQLELYLMGMIPITDVADFDVFTGVSNFDTSGDPYTFDATKKTTYTPSSLEALLGKRNPSSNTSQKNFRALVMVLTDTALTNEQWKVVNDHSRVFGSPAPDVTLIYNFWEATNGKGTIKTDELNNVTLGTIKNAAIENIVIYPNPTDDFIQFYGLNKPQGYSIYNIHGKEMITGNVDNNQKIEVKSIKSGIYFIKTENGKRFKFTRK